MNSKSKKNIDINLIICIVAVLLLFLPTINRPWLIYDERIIADGIYFPKANSFFEIFEILKTFGLNFSVLSSNTMYSSNYIVRTCPLGLFMGMILTFFFGREPLFYHLFNIGFHLLNTLIVFFTVKLFISKNKTTSLNLLLILLTLLWALHPAMIEPVLLSINFGALFSYCFFFIFFLDFLKNKEKNNSLIRQLLIPILFIIPMLTNEYIVTLPLILFIYSFAETYKTNNFKSSILISLNHTKPYVIGLLIYIFYFLFISHYTISQVENSSTIVLFLERVFWLCPQIFFHIVKLICFPLKLSIDQGIFVHLGYSIFDPYSIFCFLFLSAWLFIPLILFLSTKKFSNIFFLSWGFFFALLPFLHVLMPSYTLTAERYLYAPLAMLIFGLGKIINDSNKTHNKYTTSTIIVLSIVLIICFTRSFFRTLDWKDNYSFINSTYKTSNSSFFKAVRLGMLGKAISILEPHKQGEIQKYFQDTLKLLEVAKQEALEQKLNYQDSLPQIIKSYGLDYESLLRKIAFLEASSRCLELKENYKVGLRILEPYIQNLQIVDPRITELYTHFLLLDNRHAEAKEILLKTNSIYPQTPFILMALVDLFLKYEHDFISAEKYLLEGLKSLPYDKDILLKTLSFYQGYKDPLVTAKYASLYGLRTQSKPAYEQALSIYINTNDLKSAKNIVDKLLRLDSKDPEILYFVSRYFYKIKDYEKTLNYLTNGYENSKALKANPNVTFEIGYTLAKCLLLSGKPDNAASISKEILSFATDLESLHKVNQLYIKLGLKDYSEYSKNKINLLNMVK